MDRGLIKVPNTVNLIHDLIEKFEVKYVVKLLTGVKNYDQNKDKDKTEAEILTFFYEDIYNIEQELMTLLSVVRNLNK